MDRYIIEPWGDTYVDPNGQWVKADEAFARIKELETWIENNANPCDCHNFTEYKCPLCTILKL